MNSDVNHTFKELFMGHSIQLDDFYYDAKTEQSRRKILLEYMKAVDALTINPEFTLRRQIALYEEKLRDVPRVEQLETHLANKVIEQEVIKKQLENLQLDKQKETQSIQHIYEEKIQDLREEMSRQFSQIMSMIQKNPRVAQVKPEVLLKKMVG